jgi:hypothetical protein
VARERILPGRLVEVPMDREMTVWIAFLVHVVVFSLFWYRPERSH